MSKVTRLFRRQVGTAKELSLEELGKEHKTCGALFAPQPFFRLHTLSSRLGLGRGQTVSHTLNFFFSVGFYF